MACLAFDQPYFIYISQNIINSILKGLTFNIDKRNKLLKEIVLERRKDTVTAPELYYKDSIYLVSKRTKVKPEGPLNPAHWSSKEVWDENQ